MIELGTNICTDFEEASSREWLETNGIGGYASSSVSGAGTRRYHGLLVAATRPPLGRVVLLSRFDEAVMIDGERFEISCNQYPGSVHPRGFQYLTSFRLDPFPRWTFEINGVEIERSLFMVHGENTTVCRWKVTNVSEVLNQRYEMSDDSADIAGLDVRMELRPMLAFRNHHHLRTEDPAFDTAYSTGNGFISMTPYAEMPTLFFAHNASSVERTGLWYRNFEYAIEMERGFDYREDLFQPCSMSFDLASEAVVIASADQHTYTKAAELEKIELKRRADLVVRSEIKDESIWPLVLAADQFIVDRGAGKSVIAGYHWFSDWGRDTMIALNGLTLATGRPEVAKSIILEFSRHISQGMLPNRFPDEGETPDYNTADATLWYFEAIRAYIEVTGDYDVVRGGLYEKLVDIIDWHVRGTRFGIHVDTDGLLFAGGEGHQLTWMDAKIGDWVVTPRTGKPVEIQALWYNALRIMSDLAIRFGDEEQQAKYSEMDEVARESFNGQFWNDAENCLFDVVNGDHRDAAVRPNQIFAVSLHHTMLDPVIARKVVEKVEAELLTPVGLRSLSPKDPKYIGTYIGSPLQRDGAYHQGTVWGWLIGPFVEAYLKVHSKDPKAEKRVASIVDHFKVHLTKAMAGQVSEIFDGDPPHTPRGAAAQAWSVAEILRIGRLI
ncbi:MAG: amylo-alpha-1,6-glucosidase [Acidobacteria bacterium]|nr:amylo-alpha-1,6-glucosidase [Acidobacteriota bacterium]